MAVSSGDRFSKSGDEEETNAGEGQNKEIGNRKTNKFDPGAPPPFKIADIRAAIPAHCWVKNPWRSLSYVVWDIAAVAALLAAAVYINSWVFWPVYWIAQGTMFWALFVLGHECGHGSFSDSTMLNNVVGYVLHSSILVPYQSWRIGHRKHHQNHGHVDHDEAWAPTPERLYKKMKYTTKILIFRMPILALPFYLVNGIPSRPGSHFNPSNELFKPGERNLVIASDICCAAMLAFLFYASTIVGPILLLKLYGIPYLVFVVWFDLVTYVHHHGSEEKLPWYRGQEWSYLRGALTTTDEDYGLINKIHHDIGTHIVHHLFPQIPHYHLVEATREAKKVLGSYYREPKKSGLVPFHIFSLLIKSVGRDHYVSDDGDIVYYQTDEELFRSKKI